MENRLRGRLNQDNECNCPVHSRLLLASLAVPARSRSVVSCSKAAHRYLRQPENYCRSQHDNYNAVTPELPASHYSQHKLSHSPLTLHRLCRRSQAEEIVMSAPLPTNHGIPRRYVSGVRMECKPVPWRYASSVHLKLGSTKRRYTEKVFYKMRLVPFGYFEGATADFCHEANPGARRYIATMTLQCSNIPTLHLTQPDELRDKEADEDELTSDEEISSEV